jgi:hypothetical protein
MSTRRAHLLHELLLGVSHAGREHGLHVHLGLVQPGRLQPGLEKTRVFLKKKTSPVGFFGFFVFFGFFWFFLYIFA